MGRLLKKLRKRKTPLRLTGQEKAETVPPQAVPDGPRGRNRLSAEERCALLELLRGGLSHKQAINKFAAEKGKKVGRRTLLRWSAAVTADKASPRKALQLNYARCGRGGSDQGKFRQILVPYLDRHFRARNGLPFKHQWVYWTVTEIRFMLVFGVLPIRIALNQSAYMLLSGLEQAGDDAQGIWRDWYDNQIKTRLLQEKPSPMMGRALAWAEASYELERLPQFPEQFKFCERSIRAALYAAGYHYRRPRFGGAPSWTKDPEKAN